MTKRKDYVIDTSKIKTLKDVRNIFECLGIICDISILEENDPRYELTKEYFVIPYVEEPRKSLEEIQQELDEKFEKLIEKTHLEYRIGHKWLYKKKRYEEFCKKQDADFEYARKNGFFLPTLTVGALEGSYLVSNGITSSFVSPTYVIKQGNNHEGYYTFGTGFVRYYMPTKPNAITRWFMKNCLSFIWVSEK